MSTFATNDDRMDLGWYWNDSEGCLGLTGIDYAGAGGSPACTSDAAERKQEHMLESATRFRRISLTLARLPVTKQRSLQEAFVRVPVPLTLSNRPPLYVAAAYGSDAVREFLAALGVRWSLKAARDWLARAERPTKEMTIPLDKLVALRIAAWSQAEATVDALLDVYAVARREQRAASEAERIAVLKMNRQQIRGAA